MDRKTDSVSVPGILGGMSPEALSELIETIEERPDTTIRLVNGKHFVVAESAAEVISKVVTFKRSIYR